ncbi:MAG TPA: hypothetical protein VNQ33_04245 [Acidimicrobiales bacterium]|nr:hypothetical protein [Acidimicrobiales bacterium]
MNPENSFYGHRSVLAEAIGSDDPVPRYRAHVQHGWAPFSPVGHPERVVPSLRYLTWSGGDARTVRSQGIDGVEAVGAPFLYLRRSKGLDGSAPAPRPGDGSMLVYPSHGWEREQMQGNHRRFVDEIRDRAEGPVTVCLYWIEFRQADLRQAYESAGFRVISHGTRDDPGFLWRQLDELLRHDIVASNHLSTAVWYGGAVGRDLVRFGPEFTMYGEAYRQAWAAYQRRRWPELDERIVAGADAVAMAEAELGADCLRDQAELRGLLAPLDAAARPWRTRARRARTFGEYTGRRTVAVARSRIRPGQIQRRDLETMARGGPAAPAPDTSARPRPSERG